jgi:lysophospholipase L1-like esterase
MQTMGSFITNLGTWLGSGIGNALLFAFFYFSTLLLIVKLKSEFFSDSSRRALNTLLVVLFCFGVFLFIKLMQPLTPPYLPKGFDNQAYDAERQTDRKPFFLLKKLDCRSIPPGTTLVAIGDSNTKSSESYADFIKSECAHVKVLKFGFSGKSAEYIFQETVAQYNYKQPGKTYLIVYAGVNCVSEAKAALEKIYSKARQDGLSVVGVTITPWAGYGLYYKSPKYQKETDEVNDWIRRNADVVVDVYDYFEDPDRENHLLSSVARDNIHLNALGQKALGYKIIEQTF